MQVKYGKFSHLNIYGWEASVQKEFVKRECYIFLKHELKNQKFV